MVLSHPRARDVRTTDITPVAREGPGPADVLRTARTRTARAHGPRTTAGPAVPKVVARPRARNSHGLRLHASDKRPPAKNDRDSHAAHVRSAPAGQERPRLPRSTHTARAHGPETPTAFGLPRNQPGQQQRVWPPSHRHATAAGSQRSPAAVAEGLGDWLQELTQKPDSSRRRRQRSSILSMKLPSDDVPCWARGRSGP